jgi:hypothetical protein
MDIFRPFRMQWWQTGLFKVSMVSLGIALGANWPEFFSRWIVLLLLVFGVTALYIASVWWRQVRS